jgi:hypothetical protein
VRELLILFNFGGPDLITSTGGTECQTAETGTILAVLRVFRCRQLAGLRPGASGVTVTTCDCRDIPNIHGVLEGDSYLVLD